VRKTLGVDKDIACYRWNYVYVISMQYFVSINTVNTVEIRR
jgi:hypothetical protein